MEVSYYNLSGGINTSLTKTEMGNDTKKIYWADSKNIEIFKNRGITKQKGNVLFLELPEKEKITGLYELVISDGYKMVITTESGKIYVYDEFYKKFNLLEQTLEGNKPLFCKFLNGVLITTEKDALFYLYMKSDGTYTIEDCSLKDTQGKNVKGAIISVFKGRVFAASGSTVYYSALGTYNDFTTENDAGYFKDFHTDTGNITALSPYKDYLAIYKIGKVFLLTGTTPDDFQIIPFADKGSYSPSAITNVDNKQYFLSDGIYALEQVGELNQIQLGSEISQKIREELLGFDNTCLSQSFCVNYPKKNQVWYYFKHSNSPYFSTVWINDCCNKAWYKRTVPQNVTCAALYNGNIYIGDDEGNIYKEDTGNTFNGKAIDFMWKSPFLAVTNTNRRKIIDEFYFLLDNSDDNDFEFTVYKDYESEFADDPEHIFSSHLTWAGDEDEDTTAKNRYWPKDEESYPVWSISSDVMEKAEISESNLSVQLCVSGTEITNSCSIIGLYFKEIYSDE